MSAIEVSGLTKRFGDLAAVNSVSFSVGEEEFFGFLGPNGAGKTTLIRMLTTLIKPTEGKAVVAGFDVVQRPEEVRRSIGVVPQAMTSDLDLTGYENMDIYGRFYSIPGRERKERVAYLLELVGLHERANDLVATYSGGMRRRLEVIKALIHRPNILFLDEPTQGLDPQSRRTVWEFLVNFMKEGGLTIFLTTHYMEEAEALCDRVGIVDYGSIIVLDSPSALKSQLPEKDRIVLEFAELGEGVPGALEGLDFVHGLKREGTTLTVEVKSGSQMVAPLLQKISELGGAVSSVSVRERSLEDVFIHHTGRSIRQEEAKKVSYLIGAGAPKKWVQR